MIEITPELLASLMFACLFVCLLMGFPIAFVLGGIAVIFGLLSWGPMSFHMFINQIFTIMSNYLLVSVPLFIFMAQMLDQSCIVEKLFDAIRYLLGPLRGGIAISVVVVSTVFGACTGIIGASVITMGVIALPIMLKYGYDKRLSCGCISAGGALGILIPPSIMLIVMADQSKVSVGKLFAGAIIPGLILSSLYILYILYKCYRDPNAGPPLSVEERSSVSSKEKLLMLIKSALPPSILVLGVLGSIFTGTATPTEASGVGAFLAVLLAILYRRFTLSSLIESLLQTGKATSMVIMTIIGASCFTGVFFWTRGKTSR